MKSKGTPDCHCPVKFLLSHCSVSPKYTWFLHILFISVQPCMHTCTAITSSLDWMLSFTWMWTFLCPGADSTPSPPCMLFCLETCHSFRSVQTQESFGPSCLQRQESTSLMADIKEHTCSLETHLRPNNSLNNPLCPSPSDNTHWVLQHHYLQFEMTRPNPNPGRCF